MNSELLRKYNVPGPRYTSYPTVPYWENNPDQQQWLNLLSGSFIDSAGHISLYIHLPYCESLCTYCGCNTRITVNHAVELPYIEAVLKEWKLYTTALPFRPVIGELHLGGGTPTFFSPENLKKLIDGIFELADKSENFQPGFEGHPANTTAAHLKQLYDLGFRRVSFGIQDFDPKVQDVIHRFQSYEQVKDVTETARSIGYTSVNYDLIYGLPLQTEAGMSDTLEKVKTLRPDRIAYYSYAHVPWIKPGQRKFTEKDLPDAVLKRTLYEKGRELFESEGYIEIGMDHFALPEDELFIASKEGRLHRNFMGYTTDNSKVLIGLGVSSISDSWNCFAQNVKVVEEYIGIVNSGHLPIFRGHILTDEDLNIRRHILNIMCRFFTGLDDEVDLSAVIEKLNEIQADDLVIITDKEVRVTELGKPFIRNICMAFDARLWRKEPVTQLFSQTV